MGAGQTPLDGEHRTLGGLNWALLGLQSRAGLLAEKWALTSLKPLFPEALHAWGVRPNEDVPQFPSSFPRLPARATEARGGVAGLCEGRGPSPCTLSVG